MTSETELVPWQWGYLGTKSWCTSLVRYLGMWDRVEVRDTGRASTGHGQCCSGEEMGNRAVWEPQFSQGASRAPNDWLPWVGSLERKSWGACVVSGQVGLKHKGNWWTGLFGPTQSPFGGYEEKLWSLWKFFNFSYWNLCISLQF